MTLEKAGFWKDFLGRSAKITAICIFCGIAFAGLMGFQAFIPAMLFIALWLFVNNYFLYCIGTLFNDSENFNKRKALFLCLLKFPILYLGGLLFILTPFIKLEGILTGFTAYIFVTIFLLLEKRWRNK